MQDSYVTPQDNKSPIKELEKDVPGPLYRDLHQEIYGYLQVTFIETEENIIGFEALSNVKSEMYLKYDHAWVISSPNIFGNYYQEPGGSGFPMTRLRIQLANKVLTLKRYYVQLIDILGDVGGLMEVVFSLLNIISSIVVGILYEESLVNNLFSFDLDKKIISLKEKHNKKKIVFINKDEPLFDLSYSLNNKKRQSLNINVDSLFSNNKYIEDSSLKPVQINDKEGKIIKIKKKVKRRIKRSGSQHDPSKINIYGRNKMQNKNIDENQKELDKNGLSRKSENNQIIKYEEQPHNKEGDKNITNIENNNINENINENKYGIVDKITLNKFLVHLCFCWIRIPQNKNNLLLDEGMKIIMEQLEIFNLFMKLYKEEKMQRNIDQKTYMIEMSDEFKKKFLEIEKEELYKNDKSSISSD